MIHAGFTIDNPFTKSHTVVLESDVETKGNGWLVEVRCPPKGRPDGGEHLHLTWTETFEIISGTAYYKLDGSQHTVQASEKFVVLPRHAHVHPWNAGDTETAYFNHSRPPMECILITRNLLGIIPPSTACTRLGYRLVVPALWCRVSSG